MVVIERATADHARHLAPKLRLKDAAEVRAMGLSNLTALTNSMAWSTHAFAAIDTASDEVLCMWGYCQESLLCDRVALWLLGSPHLRAHRREFLRLSKTFVDAVLTEHAEVECLVDSRYNEAVRWVLWLGFEPQEHRTMNGVVFIQFVRGC